MKDSKQILNQLEPKIAQSPNNSVTAAGRPEVEPELSSEQKSLLIDTINECFEVLRLNYQHVYFSAYPEVAAVNSAKRLWMESLNRFEPNTIRQAVMQLVKTSDYLPTISRVIKQCLTLNGGSELPDAHSAYIEACRAPSPKQNYDWTHPAIYYAGKNSDWYFLQNNSEQIAFPVFKTHYEKLCEQLANGGVLTEIKLLALPETTETPLSKEENAAHMAALRNELDI